MAKPNPIPEQTVGSGIGFDGDLVLLALPLQTFRELSDLAFKQNKTIAQLFTKAIEEYVARERGQI